MADKKITELTEVTSLPDDALLTAVDTSRSVGDQNVSIQKSNLQFITGFQDFTATDGQTEFTITASPSSLKMVFKGRTLALDGVDYTYSSGTLTFNTGLILNTKVKVIY
jgi:hypothetical protein